MTNASVPVWEKFATPETRDVEQALTEAGFQTVNAYRYNSAAIRVRVVDPRFEGLSREDRDAMVEPHLARFPERTQADIITLLTLAIQLQQSPATFRQYLVNAEFDDPSPSML